MEYVIVANGHGEQEALDAESPDDAWRLFSERYIPAGSRSNYTVLTRAEADHLRECAEQDERDNYRRRHGLDEVYDPTEGPTGIAFRSQRSA